MPLPGADDDRDSQFAALAEVAEAFTTLVHALTDDGAHRPMTPQRIVDLATGCMRHGKHTALVGLQDGVVRSIAATTDLPARVDAIRSETGQGPSIDVLDINDVVVSNDLVSDPRWPRFGLRVVDELGIRSIVSYRLYLSRQHRAALSFYSDWPHAFDNLSITTGAIFAAYCSLATHSQLLLDEPVTRRRAAEVHREIGVAVGILMATGDLTVEAAYRRLHHASTRLQGSLPEVARHIIASHQTARPPNVEQPPDR